jgi:hypothetical protein
MPGQIRYAMMSLDQRRRLSATVQLPEVRSLKWACSRHRKGVPIVDCDTLIRLCLHEGSFSEVGYEFLGAFWLVLLDLLIPAIGATRLQPSASSPVPILMGKVLVLLAFKEE